jgi:hypothetical protein
MTGHEMPKRQPTVNSQLPSTKTKRNCKFGIFTALEVFTHCARELEPEPILNKLIPGRLAYAKTSGGKIL